MKSFQRGQCKFVQLSLDPGQGLTNHHTPLALAVIVLTGTIRFTTGEQDEVLHTADMLVLDPRVEHAVEALERSIVLLVLVPDTPGQTSNPPAIKFN
jgi:quercetin dioxygenase-like cupin family protein